MRRSWRFFRQGFKGHFAEEQRFAIVLDAAGVSTARPALWLGGKQPAGAEHYRNWVDEEALRGQYPNLDGASPRASASIAPTPCAHVCPRRHRGQSDVVHVV
jgi:hypothetical protein